MVETMYVELSKEGREWIYCQESDDLGIDLRDLRTLAPWIPEDAPLWVCMECGKVNEMGSWGCEGCGKPLLTWLPGEGYVRWAVEKWAGSGWCDG